MQTLEAVVIKHYVAPAQKHKSDYVSSIVCLGKTGEFRVTTKSCNVPPVGAVIVVCFDSLTIRGLPKSPRLVTARKATDIEQLLVDELSSKLHVSGSKGPPIYTVESLQALKSPKIMHRGEQIRIPDSKGEGYHTLTVSQAGQIYCDCGSWRYQKLPPKERTCKHCTLVAPLIHVTDS